MGELKLTFSGACVQVFGSVPGVPLRAVLPDALAVRFGRIRIPAPPGKPIDVAYYLMPHLAYVKDVASGRRRVLTGNLLKVVNAKPQALQTDSAGSFKLTEYKPNVQLSSQVVFEGNASAYFDICGGRVSSKGGVDEPRQTLVSIETEGKPRISISPLPGAIEPPDAEHYIETDELQIANLDLESGLEDMPFDFLLNFLVTRGGIPKELSQLTPGMKGEISKLKVRHLGQRLKALGLLIETGGTVGGWRGSVVEGDEPGPEPLITGVKASYDFFSTILGTGKLAPPGVIDPCPFDPSCSNVWFH